MEVEWDPAKARANRGKHGVDFADAAAALFDPLALTVVQDQACEDRLYTIGADLDGRMLVVVHVARSEHLRIISARRALPHERRRYQEKQ
jgi:uncharacterized DUF497 family protein